MDNRPNGREKNVTGTGKSVYRRGEGQGTGPVGSSSGHNASNGPRPTGTGSRPTGSGQQYSGGGQRTTRSGGKISIIAIIAALLLGGGGFGLNSLLGGDSAQQPSTGFSDYTNTPSSSYTTPSSSSSPSGTSSGISSGSSAGSSFGSSGSSSALSLIEQLMGGGSSGASASMLGNINSTTGSISSGWNQSANTGSLDTNVTSGAREKRTKILGNGKDVVTVMVYMCGADLESRSGMATSDLQEMMAGTIGENVNLIVFTGGAKSWRNNVVSSSNNQIYQLQSGGLRCLEKNAGNASMTKPATLTSFIQYCATNFPANRNMLIFWDHGGGSLTGYGYDEKNASSGSMGLSGINDALRNGGVTFDMIGFDTCLMGTLENALMLSDYGDYLVASEETEPGIGWYYTNWVTALSKNTSISTLDLGQRIVDDFVTTCARSCPGQGATLALIDLAELEATAPAALKNFSTSTVDLISGDNYQKVSDARSGTREFAASNRLDQIDLVHFALNLDTKESRALANTLLSAIKYNRTSTNMTNAYGLSIYFPYKSVSKVNNAVATYESIGLDSSYSRCIQQFASMEASGQAVAGGMSNPLSSLLGGSFGGYGGSAGSSSSSAGDLTGLISSLLGGGDLFSMSGLSSDRAIAYAQANQFDADALVWTDHNGIPCLVLSEEQWSLVHELELNLFIDDGTGYIDMGLDTVYSFTDDGALKGEYDGTWLAIDQQPIAFYHTNTVYDLEAGTYCITGRVPAKINGDRAELIIVFNNENPYGFIAGAQFDYRDGETETVAKTMTELQEGDIVDFLCDYYSYDGVYEDSYFLGDQWIYHADAQISNVYIDASAASATYLLTDIFNQQYWTPVIP
ncbi:MAG: peptidase C11 [Oscillospiraceae bacterium]|nr:peptidase C11 [Oscillospiraceae bacterium]